MTSWRRAVVAAAAVVAALTTTGCGPPAVTATAQCDEPVRPPAQEGGHLLGDTEPPVPYSSVPPTSGWHASGGGPLPGVYEVAVPAASLVAALEQGRVAVAHDGQLSPADRATVATLVAEVDGLLVTPHEMAPGDPPIAVLAWGVLQRCSAIDADAVVRFAQANGGVDRES